MLYNDSQLCNELQSKKISEHFSLIKAQELHDLEEVYEKMLEQKQLLISENKNGEFSSILSTTNKNIEDLGRIINKSRNIIKSSKFDLDNSHDGAYGKIPHSIAIIDHESSENQQPSPTPPSNNIDDGTPPDLSLEPNNNGFNNADSGGNQPDTTEPRPETSPTQSQPMSRRRNLLMRNYPMQNSIFSNIAKSVFKRQLKTSSIIIDDGNRNRFHNIQMLNQSNCSPRKKMVTNQIDILRLLTLYLALHPRCRFLPRICQTTSEQFEVLLHLI